MAAEAMQSNPLGGDSKEATPVANREHQGNVMMVTLETVGAGACIDTGTIERLDIHLPEFQRTPSKSPGCQI